MLRTRGRGNPALAVLCRWVPVSVLLLVASSAACSAAVETRRGEDHTAAIRIGIIGDQTFSPDIQASYGVLQQGVDVLAGQHLDVVLHVGDLVESTLPPAH